jgi:selenocysteine lyase/cysteine desulfurase
MPPALDMNEVRGSFPALAGDQVYLDNAGGTQTLRTVSERYQLAYR